MKERKGAMREERGKKKLEKYEESRKKREIKTEREKN